MKFKMRVLHFSKNDNASAIAAAISKAQQTNCDQIPPAYNCENEKLIFVCAEVGKKPDDKLVAFMSNLNADRVKNIAFIGVGTGTDAAIGVLKSMAEKLGIKVAGSMECTVKGGLFKKGKVSDADIKKCVDWADGIVNSLAS